MRFKQAFIYGFGKWVDQTFDFSNESLTCVYGENESGKSTLYHFLLFMLFGLPPKKRAFYQPKMSGKMGGRLTINDPIVGEFTIERMDGLRNGSAICYLPDGKEYDEKWLENKLSGMTSAIYQSTFAFSALDLNQFKKMKDKDLGEVLLGIGLTGSTNIYEIEARLETKMGELFKPYGKNPAINEQLQSLDKRLNELTDYQKNESTYKEKKNEISRLSDEREHIQKKLEEERETLLLVQKKIQSLPIINEYNLIKNNLQRYASDHSFPENGIDRLRDLKEKIIPLRSELTILKDNEQKIDDKRLQLEEKKINIDTLERAKDLLQKKNEYIEKEQELIRLKNDRNKFELEVNMKLEELHIGLTLVDLDDITLPFHIEQDWKQLQSANDQLILERSQVEEEQQLLKDQRINIINDLEEVEAHLLTDENLKKYEEIIRLHTEHHIMKELKVEESNKQKRWNKEKAKQLKKANVLLTLSIIISIFSGGIGLLLEVPKLYLLIGIIMLVGLGQKLWSMQTVKQIEYLMDNEQSRQPSGYINELERQEAEAILQSNKERKNNLLSMKELLHTTDIQLQNWRDRQKAINHRESQLNQKVINHRHTYPFLQHIDVKYWLEFYQTMRQLISLNRQRQQIEIEKDIINEQIQLFEQKVTSFLEEQELDVLKKSVREQLSQLDELIEENNNSQSLLEQYEENVTEIKQQQTDTKKQLLMYEKEQTNLFMIAKVETDEAFYKAANDFESKLADKIAKDRLQSQLEITFPNWEEVIKSNPEDSELHMLSKELKDRIEQLEGELERVRQRSADINAKLLQIESSELVSNTMHRYTIEKENLQQLAYKWAVLKTAKNTLAETMDAYRNKYIDRVINKTTEYFNLITESVYEKVIPPMGDKVFQVENKYKVRYKINELSKGTIDQLYIALRLAIGEIMSREHRLPFIIDDAFVHFDSLRTKNLMKILEAIATEHQLILFTCKREIKQLNTTGQTIYLQEELNLSGTKQHI